MKFVSISTALDMVPISVARSILEAEGIPCQVPNEHISTVLPHYSLATGGVDLQVPEDMVSQASEILMIYRNAKVESEPRKEEEKEILLCPKCMSNKIKEVLKPEPFSMLTFFLFLGLPVKIQKKRHQCVDCGFIWKN